MSKRLVLVDSSAWVSHLTGQVNAAAQAIDELLLTHRAAVNAIIRLEVLTGARDEAQYAELEDAFRGLHELPLSDAIWRRVERLRFQLRQAGRLIPTPDVIIACCALVYDCELLHADRHFDLMAHSAPLKVYRRGR
jgi:predicted nucleic acid-binding protein